MILLFYNIRGSLKFDFLMSPTYIHIVYFIMSFTFCFLFFLLEEIEEQNALSLWTLINLLTSQYPVLLPAHHNDLTGYERSKQNFKSALRFYAQSHLTVPKWPSDLVTTDQTSLRSPHYIRTCNETRSRKCVKELTV